jgi:hypothetical protein
MGYTDIPWITMVYPKLEMLMGEWKQLDFVPYSWTKPNVIKRYQEILRLSKPSKHRISGTYMCIL